MALSGKQGDLRHSASDRGEKTRFTSGWALDCIPNPLCIDFVWIKTSIKNGSLLITASRHTPWHPRLKNMWFAFWEKKNHAACEKREEDEWMRRDWPQFDGRHATACTAEQARVTPSSGLLAQTATHEIDARVDIMWHTDRGSHWMDGSSRTHHGANVKRREQLAAKIQSFRPRGARCTDADLCKSSSSKCKRCDQFGLLFWISSRNSTPKPESCTPHARVSNLRTQQATAELHLAGTNTPPRPSRQPHSFAPSPPYRVLATRPPPWRG